MEKTPKYQTIHLTTLIQLKTPHKPVSHTNHNTPLSTYQPLQTMYTIPMLEQNVLRLPLKVLSYNKVLKNC